MECLLIGCNFLNVKNVYFIDNGLKCIYKFKAFQCYRLIISLEIENCIISELKLFSFFKQIQQKSELS